MSRFLTRQEYAEKKAALQAQLAALERVPRRSDLRSTLDLPYLLAGVGLAVAVVLLVRHYREA